MQPLYCEQQAIVVLPAWEIPSKGFGYDRVLGVVDGKYLVLERQRAFELVCTHLVMAHNELAGSCKMCCIEAQEQGLPNPVWASQICRRSECALKECGGCRILICRRHVIPIDNASYCGECFVELGKKLKEYQDEVRFRHQVEKQGRALAYSSRFLSSLFPPKI